MARHRNRDAVSDEQVEAVVADLVKITHDAGHDLAARVHAGETVLAYAFEFDGEPFKEGSDGA